MNPSLNNSYKIYELTPYIKVFVFTIVIILALFAPTAIEKWLCDGILKHIFGLIISLIILFLAVLAPFKIQNGLEDILKQNTAQKRLDKYSLLVLKENNGLLFGGEENDIVTLRCLINLELIEFVPFPLSLGRSSWSYYLTDLGRYVLHMKLNKTKFYPLEFCLMLRVRYWQGYWEGFPKRFLKEKNDFQKYKTSWDESWKVFEGIIRKIEPGQSEKDTMTIAEKYLSGESYNAVMKNLVVPWKNETRKFDIKITGKIKNFVLDLFFN